MDPSNQQVSITEYRSNWIEDMRKGVLSSFLSGKAVDEVRIGDPEAPEASRAVVVAAFQLQKAADYRSLLRTWFTSVKIGGHLVVAVPHAFLHERQLSLPSRWDPSQRRLYTPRSLLEEVEEALAPNSYRVRYLTDLDKDYDYTLDVDQGPTGQSDVVLVLERIQAPRWTPTLVVEERQAKPRLQTPDYAFEPARTRTEVAVRPRIGKILLLKLDHLGDFIIGLGPLERVRTLFPDAEITLVVGSWNIDMARNLGLADNLIAFDAFPRNSTEEEVNVAGKAAIFQTLVTGDFDLAIDLRTDWDTRFLLRYVKASIRAGIGPRSQFPFLDIFLPVDFNRNEPETAREFIFDHHRFSTQGSSEQTPNRIISHAELAERDCAIVWGPYFGLRPGNYVFEPRLDVDKTKPGLLLLDIAINTKRVVQDFISGPTTARLAFRVEKPGVEFEFRIWTVDIQPALDFSFYGGRLIREGAASVLHQSEYGLLLLELVRVRLARTGLLAEQAPA